MDKPSIERGCILKCEGEALSEVRYQLRIAGGPVRSTRSGFSPRRVSPAVSTNSAELYDASTHTWTLSEMTTARSGHTATLLQSGQVLVVGGDNFDRATAEVYDPATNPWQQVMNNLNSFRI
jgi:hypothetical protein